MENILLISRDIALRNKCVAANVSNFVVIAEQEDGVWYEGIQELVFCPVEDQSGWSWLIQLDCKQETPNKEELPNN